MKDPCTICLLKMVCIEACDSFCQYLMKDVDSYLGVRFPMNMLDKRIKNGLDKIYYEKVKNERRNNFN